MKQRIGAWISRQRQAHPTRWAALKTGLAAWGALFIPAMLGYMDELREWLTAPNIEGAFPMPDSLGPVFVSAVAGAVTAVINFCWNKLMNNDIKYNDTNRED